MFEIYIYIYRSNKPLPIVSVWVVELYMTVEFTCERVTSQSVSASAAATTVKIVNGRSIMTLHTFESSS